MDEGFFVYPGGGSSLRLVRTSGAPYKMTAQARTKRGLWGYLFTGRKIVILSFGVLEIGDCGV